MDERSARQITEDLGLTWKGDFMEALSEEEEEAGYINFNIPNPESPDDLNGEGVWGWMTPEDKKKYDDDSFTGKLPVILCNDPLYYSGTLFAGQELVVRCNGSLRPILDPEWVKEHLHRFVTEPESETAKDYTDAIEEVATRILKISFGDYDARIWKEIRDSVLCDVIECSGINEGCGFTDGDVSLAIGRAICKLTGIDI